VCLSVLCRRRGRVHANDVVVIAGLGMNHLTKQEIQSATMACPDSGFKHRDSPESTELSTCPKVFFRTCNLSKTGRATPLWFFDYFEKAFKGRYFVMSERTARLRAHHQNIERYQYLLKTEVGEVELQYLERRLAEERFAIAMLMDPSAVWGNNNQPN
jgi:hypothetical protein